MGEKLLNDEMLDGVAGGIRDLNISNSGGSTSEGNGGDATQIVIDNSTNVSYTQYSTKETQTIISKSR